MTTHVANGSDFSILVMCDGDRAHISSKSEAVAQAVSKAIERAGSQSNSHSSKNDVETNFSASGWGVSGSGGVNVRKANENSNASSFGNKDSNSNSSSRSNSMNEAIYHTASSFGFTKVPPGQVLPFRTPNTGTVYTSVYSVEHGKLHPVCMAYPRDNNYSLIVTKRSNIRPSKMGCVWIDEITGQDARIV